MYFQKRNFIQNVSYNLYLNINIAGEIGTYGQLGFKHVLEAEGLAIVRPSLYLLYSDH